MKEKLKKFAKAAWDLAKWLYLPIYVLGYLLYILARILLALAYILILEGRRARDIIKYLFVWY